MYLTSRTKLCSCMCDYVPRISSINCSSMLYQVQLVSLYIASTACPNKCKELAKQDISKLVSLIACCVHSTRSCLVLHTSPAQRHAGVDLKLAGEAVNRAG
eukprot:scpid84599/ scgid6407/ 